MPDEKTHTIGKGGSASEVTSITPITQETNRRSNPFVVNKEIFEKQ